jgi:hypothetical protein
MRQIRVTVSGSFTRHLKPIQNAVQRLNALGVRVLSPEQPTIVDAVDGFVFVASDRHRSVRLVQDRHLAAIMNSDLLWLECADGHVGQSAALELGFALAAGVPVYSTALPCDLTMRQYVCKVASIDEAIASVSQRAIAEDVNSLALIVDPINTAALVHQQLDQVTAALTTGTIEDGSSAMLYRRVGELSDSIVQAIAMPTNPWSSSN